MKEMVKEFMEAVENVKVMAEIQILDNEEFWNENSDIMEEIDCMKEHCEICLKILKKLSKKS